jgi:hypothetical protein
MLDHVEVDVTPPPRGSSRLPQTFLRPARFAVDVFPFEYPGAPAPVLLGVSDVPVVQDNGANHESKAAQAITWPCEVSGQLERGDEKDWYLIDAKRGDVVWLELYGERIGSPVDLDLSVFDAGGERELLHLTDCLENPGVGGI